MTLQTKRWDTERQARMSTPIWQTDMTKSITRDDGVFFYPGSDHVVGGMSLTSDGLVSEPWGVMATDDTIPPSRRLLW